MKYIQKRTEEKIIFLDNDIKPNPKILESKTVYELLLNKVQQRPYMEKQWERILNIN